MCKGRGTQLHVQHIGPGMVQQIQTVCIECQGQGERIHPRDRCEECSGAKVIREKKTVEVHVEKGEAAHGRPRAATPPCPGPLDGFVAMRLQDRWLMRRMGGGPQA